MRHDPVSHGQRRQVDGVGRAEELFEPVVIEQLGLREEREDAPAPVVDDHDGEIDRRDRPGRASALLSWSKAMSPTRTVVGAPVRATPTAVETTPSMPLAPRLARTRTPSRARENHSTSRIGMDDDTTSVAPSGRRGHDVTRHPGLVDLFVRGGHRLDHGIDRVIRGQPRLRPRRRHRIHRRRSDTGPPTRPMPRRRDRRSVRGRATRRRHRRAPVWHPPA